MNGLMKMPQYDHPPEDAFNAPKHRDELPDRQYEATVDFTGAKVVLTTRSHFARCNSSEDARIVAEALNKRFGY